MWRFQFPESRGAARPEDQIRLSVSLSQTHHPAGDLPLSFPLEAERDHLGSAGKLPWGGEEESQAGRMVELK